MNRNQQTNSRTGVSAAVSLWGAALVLAVVGFATEARAESPIVGNAEISLGPYYPSIDEEFSDSNPFQETFGDDNRLMGEFGAEYYLFTRHGKLGLGGSVGYSNFTGESDVGSGDQQNDGGMDGGGMNGGGMDGDGEGGDSPQLDEETTFAVYPLRGSVSYRWDFLVHELSIPLAPKLEAGLDYWLWRVKDGSGETSVVEGNKAGGGTAGWHVSARMEFWLNFISPSTAAAFDVTWGVNNTYLYGEYEYSQVDDFGGESFQLGGSTWRVGLAFEF